LTKEVGIDIATGAILGDALEKTENSNGVERVLIQVRQEYQSVLALLSDNGSANRAADAEASSSKLRRTDLPSLPSMDEWY
jgi:hypothetical protein